MTYCCGLYADSVEPTVDPEYNHIQNVDSSRDSGRHSSRVGNIYTQSVQKIGSCISVPDEINTKVRSGYYYYNLSTIKKLPQSNSVDQMCTSAVFKTGWRLGLVEIRNNCKTWYRMVCFISFVKCSIRRVH